MCQPAIAKPVIGVTFAANLITDPYLIFIPIPMLWKSSLKLIKKIATTIVLSAGIFILVCATLKSVFLLVVSQHQPSTHTFGSENNQPEANIHVPRSATRKRCRRR